MHVNLLQFELNLNELKHNISEQGGNLRANSTESKQYSKEMVPLCHAEIKSKPWVRIRAEARVRVWIIRMMAKEKSETVGVGRRSERGHLEVSISSVTRVR